MDNQRDKMGEGAGRTVEKTHIDGTVDYVSADVLGGEVAEMPAGYFRSAQFIGTVVVSNLLSNSPLIMFSLLGVVETNFTWAPHPVLLPSLV